MSSIRSGPGWLSQCMSFVGSVFGLNAHQSPRYQDSARLFTKEELSSLQAGFEKLAGPQMTLDKAALLELLGLQHLDDQLGNRLSAIVSEGEDRVSFEQLVIAKSRCLKGSPDEAASFCFNILDSGRRGLVSQQEFITAATGCAAVALHDQAGADQGWAHALAEGAFEESTAQGLSLNAFTHWSKKLPALVTSLRSLLASGSSENGSALTSTTIHVKVPRLMLPAGLLRGSCMLCPEHAWLLSSRLPAKEQANLVICELQSEVWQLLFHSNKHGQSFNTFMGHVGGKGPTILVVRDKKGHVFGGYASESWTKNGKFFGNFNNFLFQLLPKIAIYGPSGANQNFQYCGHNFASLPNGLGFGGQVNYWSLFIDGLFESGMSHKGATFTNPMSLSADTNFQVDAVECWLTQQPEEEEVPRSATGSVLDRFTEDRNMLAMAGKGVQHSAGYREAPPEEDL